MQLHLVAERRGLKSNNRNVIVNLDQNNNLFDNDNLLSSYTLLDPLTTLTLTSSSYFCNLAKCSLPILFL